MPGKMQPHNLHNYTNSSGQLRFEVEAKKKGNLQYNTTSH